MNRPGDIFPAVRYILIGCLLSARLTAQTNLQPSFSQEGRITTDYGEAVENVKVAFVEKNTANTLCTFTSPSGKFQIPLDLHNADLMITPEKNGDFLNGINILDVFLLNRAVQNNDFETAYQKLAGDINGDKKTDETDVALLHQLVAGAVPAHNFQSWQFFDADCVPPAGNPFDACASAKALNKNGGTPDFIAVKTGDMDNSAQANASQSAHDYRDGEVFFNLEDFSLRAEHEFELEFRPAAQKIVAYQLALYLGDLQVLEIDKGKNEKSIFLYDEAKRVIYISGFAPPKDFKLRLRATQTGPLSRQINIMKTSHAYDEDLKHYSIALRFGDKTNNRLVVYQNIPNPFATTSVINFFLPEKSETILEIVDRDGRKIKEEKKFFPKGMNDFVIHAEEMPHPGLYYYTIKTQNEAATGKMVIWN